VFFLQQLNKGGLDEDMGTHLSYTAV